MLPTEGRAPIWARRWVEATELSGVPGSQEPPKSRLPQARDHPHDFPTFAAIATMFMSAFPVFGPRFLFPPNRSGAGKGRYGKCRERIIKSSATRTTPRRTGRDLRPLASARAIPASATAVLTHVVNYDVPSAPDAYVHRIGRVGGSAARVWRSRWPNHPSSASSATSSG
jgi:hypothetical protein